MPVPAGGSPGGRELSRREAEIANSYEIEGLPSISEVRRFHKIPSLSNGRKTSVKTWSIGGARGPAAQARPEAQKRAGNQEVVHEGLVLKRGRIFSAFQDRLFTLYPNSLTYSRSTSKKPVGRVNFGRGLEISSGKGLPAESKDEEGLFVFSLRDQAHRVMHCAVRDEAARDEWVRLLQASAEKSVHNAEVAELLHEDESRQVDDSAGYGSGKVGGHEYARAWFFPELPWGAPPSWQLYGNPQTSWLLPWDILTAFACIYVGLTVPYTSFVDNVKEPADQIFTGCALKVVGTWSYEDSEVGWKVRTRSLAAGLDLVCDLLFLLDLVIAFLTARWIIDSEGREHWRLIDDLATIRKMYIWPCKENNFNVLPQFWIDLLGVIPWQYADCLLRDTLEQSVIKTIRVLKMIKLSRLVRLQRLIKIFRFKFPGSAFILNFAQLLLVLFFMAHWMSCLWFCVGANSGSGGWIEGAGLADIVLIADGDSEREALVFTYSANQGNSLTAREFEWVTSLYWAITTMTTIGYGDISAGTLGERAFAIVVMMIGCGFFAWSTGVITSLLTATDFSAARFKETMDELEEFMIARGLPEYLCVRLKSFYMLKFPTMRIYDEDSVLEGLPQGLAKEVRIELFKDIMLICPLFYGMDIVDDNGSYSDVAAAACWRIRTVYKTMGLELTRTGEVPDALYIVRYGALSVFHSGKEIGIAHRGDVVGEMALLGLTIDGLRSRTTICASMCELCRLSKEDLQALLLIEGFRKPLRRMIGLYLSDIEKVIKEAKGSDEAFSAKLQSIPWRHIKSSLLERDAEEERERLRKERDAAHLEQGAAAASMGKMLSVKNLFGESMAGALMEKILGQASFCGVGPEAVWSGNGKDACDKMLKTKLRLTLNKLSVPKEDPGGAQEMVLAASWQAPPNRVFRAFSPSICVFMERGEGQVEASGQLLAESASLTLTLLHPLRRSWEDLQDVKIVLYRVEDAAYAPPAEDDAFERLDGRAGAPSSPAMEAQEQDVGLRLIAVGSVPIKTLVRDRMQANKRARTGAAGVRALAAMFVGAVAPLPECVVKLGEVADMQARLHLSVSVRRVLSANSRWISVLSLIRSRAGNLYFKRLLHRRLRRMRKNLFLLFDSVQSSTPAAAEGRSGSAMSGEQVEDIKKGVAGTNARVQRIESSVAGMEHQIADLGAQMSRIESLLLAGVTTDEGSRPARGFPVTNADVHPRFGH